jgi:hypothetical protein
MRGMVGVTAAPTPAAALTTPATCALAVVLSAPMSAAPIAVVKKIGVLYMAVPPLSVDVF